MEHCCTRFEAHTHSDRRRSVLLLFFCWFIQKLFRISGSLCSITIPFWLKILFRNFIVLNFGINWIRPILTQKKAHHTKAFFPFTDNKNSLRRIFHKIYFDCLRVNTFLGQLINVCYPLWLKSYAILGIGTIRLCCSFRFGGSFIHPTSTMGRKKNNVEELFLTVARSGF